MKHSLLLLISTTALVMTGCVATDPYYSGYRYIPRNCQPVPYAQRIQSQSYYQTPPQYYRVRDYSCNPNTRYRNYSNAPLIVERPSGTIIVPRSWD
jgi:hypothetical protein